MKNELFNNLVKLAGSAFGKANQEAYNNKQNTFMYQGRSIATWQPGTSQKANFLSNDKPTMVMTRQQNVPQNVQQNTKNMQQRFTPLSNRPKDQQNRLMQMLGNSVPTKQKAPVKTKESVQDRNDRGLLDKKDVPIERDPRNPYGIKQNKNNPTDTTLPRTNGRKVDAISLTTETVRKTGARVVANTWEPQGYDIHAIKNNLKNIGKNITNIPGAVYNNTPIYNTNPKTPEGKINSDRLVPYYNSMGINPPDQTKNDKGGYKDWFIDRVSNTVTPKGKQFQKTFIDAGNETKPYHDEVMGNFNQKVEGKKVVQNDRWDYGLNGGNTNPLTPPFMRGQSSTGESVYSPSNIARTAANGLLNTNPTNIKFQFDKKYYNPGSIKNQGVDHSPLSKDNPYSNTGKKKS